jgi:hypothetical protein
MSVKSQKLSGRTDLLSNIWPSLSSAMDNPCIDYSSMVHDNHSVQELTIGPRLSEKCVYFLAVSEVKFPKSVSGSGVCESNGVMTGIFESLEDN